MRVVKVLNNSLVMALDDSGQEVVLMGKGIGFKKAVGNILNTAEIEKTFVLKDRVTSRSIIRLAADTDEVFFELAKNIIDYAKTKYAMILMEHLYLSLTDHLSYAVQRTKKGICFDNFYAEDMKKFNPHEFEVGQYALRLVAERTGILLPADEAGNIAYHFINAQEANPYSETNLKINNLVTDILNIIKYTFLLEYDVNSTAYERCVTHLRLFARRLLEQEMPPDEQNMILFDEITANCAEEYNCVKRIDAYILSKFQIHLSTQEILYLVIHIHRVAASNMARR